MIHYKRFKGIVLWCLLAATACQPTSTPAPTPDQPTPTPVLSPADSVSTTSTTGCEAGDPTRESPLATHQVFYTVGVDGSHFDQGGVQVLEQASVPDGVIGPDGAVWVYFVNGRPGQHGIFAARQTSGGAWEIVDCIRLDGRFEGNAVDPDITRLPDGRYRLVYFLGHFVDKIPPSPGEPHPIYSAISEDGRNFTVEGQLIAVEGVTDPSLAQLPDGRWLLALTRDGHTLLADSDDGAHFELTGVDIEMNGIPELAVLPDGRTHLFISQHLVSEDGGQTWTVDTGSRVPGGGADPSLVALPDGTFMFFYKTFSDQPGGAPGQPPPRPERPETTPRSKTAVSLACPLFPADNIWNVRVDNLPLDPDSDAYINTIGASATMHADFGSGTWNGAPIGIPYVEVPGSQPTVPVTFDYDDESDSGPYPIPPDAPIEGGPNSGGDRHVLVLDSDNCILYELFDAHPQNGGSSWTAGSGAIFDLNSHDLRPDGWTSADAAGLPILPGLVRYDEVTAGAIHHAIRFTAPQTRRDYVWPARHFASSLTGSQYPPMGQRFRLKANYDISSFSTEVQVILQAMKTYGLILADNGSAWYISGVPDENWNNDDLHDFDTIPGSAFEAVDVSALMIHPDSGQAAIFDEFVYLPTVQAQP